MIYLISTVALVLMAITCYLVARRAVKMKAEHAQEREKLQAEVKRLTDLLKDEAEDLPPEKRILWAIGDITEVDLGHGVYALAKILDFDDDGGDTAVLLFLGGQPTRWEGGKKVEGSGFGYWRQVPVDKLRKPRTPPEPTP